MADWQPPAEAKIVPSGGWTPPAEAKIVAPPVTPEKGHEGQEGDLTDAVHRYREAGRPSMFSLEGVKQTLLPPSLTPSPSRSPYRPGESMGQYVRENPQDKSRALDIALSVGPGNLGAGGVVKPATELATENQARAAISKQFAKGVKGGAPTASDVLQEMNRAKAQGQPLTLADVNNPPLGSLAGATYRSGGAASAVMKGFMEKRGAEAVGRTENLIKSHLSDESYRSTADALIKARSSHARPLYEKASAVGPIWSDRLGQLLDQPEIQSGIKRGYNIERRNAVGKGEDFKPHEYAVTSFNEAGDPVFDKVPTMKLMMVAKEGLDAIIESPAMKNPLTGRPTKAGLSYINLRDGLLSELDRLNPSYKAARDAWSGDTASVRALDDGRNFLDQKRFSPEELTESVGRMSESDRQFFTIGVADALKNRLFRGVDTPAGTRGVINTEDARMRLRPLFGSEEAAQEFIDAMERERVMTRTATRVYGGSPTAERELADKTTEATLHAAHGILRLFEGRFLSAAASAMRARQLFGGKPNPELSEAIARAMVDPEIGISEVGALLPPKPIPAPAPKSPSGAASPNLYFRAAAGQQNDPYMNLMGHIPP